MKWNADSYTNNFNFIHEYGEALIDLISCKDNMRILDLGCGNGQLTEKLAGIGNVLGIDSSIDMINKAKELHPNIEFKCDNALSFELKDKVDVVFSNAVFHWVQEQDALIRNIYNNLNEYGQLVCEFGGYGNTKTVHDMLRQKVEQFGFTFNFIYYFPTIGEYTSLLEKHGFRVTYALLFERPTVLDGESGLYDFLNMFTSPLMEYVDNDKKQIIYKETEEALRPVLYKNNQWIADYVRIRVKAEKRF